MHSANAKQPWVLMFDKHMHPEMNKSYAEKLLFKKEFT